MKSDNVIQQKSYMFAVRIVKLCQLLIQVQKEFILSKQLIRSGTSIGANVEESIGAQSKADFIHKLSISYKEARETSYWIRLLKDTGYISLTDFESLHKDIDEICRIISAIQISTKKTLPKHKFVIRNSNIRNSQIRNSYIRNS